MRKDEAVKNLQQLIDIAVQRGLFVTANDVLNIQQALHLLAGPQPIPEPEN